MAESNPSSKEPHPDAYRHWLATSARMFERFMIDAEDPTNAEHYAVLGPHLRVLTTHTTEARVSLDLTIGYLNDLGVSSQRYGDLYEAEELYRSSIDTAQLVDAAEQEGAALAAKSNLGALLTQIGDFEAAEPLLREVLSSTGEIGLSAPECAASMMNLGALLVDSGRLDEAEPLLKEALDIEERELGTKSAEYALTLANIGNLERQRGNGSLAWECLQEALATLEDVHGRFHPDVAFTYDQLCQLCVKAKLADRAIYFGEMAAGIGYEIYHRPTRELGTFTANLGNAYRWANNFQDASDAYNEARRILVRTLGEGHQFVWMVDRNIEILEAEINNPRRRRSR